MAPLAWIELHQELREHRKIYACAEMLKISRVTMVGTIVSLWLWALDNMPDGSLEGVSNRTIARVCDFPERKADTLVNALTATGWLDRYGDTLAIHDWNEYVGKLMDRRKKDRERKKKSSGIPTEVHRNSTPIPALQYPNSTITVQNHTVSTHNTETDTHADTGSTPASPFSGKSFTAFWEAYPKKIDRESAWEAWKALNPSVETAEQIINALVVWKKSSQWTEDGDRFIPNAAKFLAKEHWKAPPRTGTGKNAVPKGASGELGAAELDNIKRLLAEEDRP